MKPFMEQFLEHAETKSNELILSDESNPKGITYGKLGVLSGKVYAYLQSKGIGRDDFVMICLPRGMQPLIALAGVWRNGSAFVLVEDNYAPERINFIYEDCKCKLMIDSKTWEEIQHFEAKEGYAPRDMHDAAFAIYTSGTTGNPKGVLHEYGNIEKMVDSFTMNNDDQLTQPGDRFALVAPLNFIASILITVYGFYYANLNYIVPYSTVKNPLSIGLFLVKNRITGTFMTPSLIKKLKSVPGSLKFCIIGSEPANEVYLEGLKIHNFYLMSESGFAVTHFVIDKLYEQTPVGKPEFDFEVMLLDEDGNPVPDGEHGEICFKNEFVRGYIGLPEETAKAFKDGIYHTNDIGFKDENGNLIVSGRLNDMVKINGNRVEPAEIEGVARNVLGVDWAGCRIIDNGRQINICVYYLKNMKLDVDQVREEMSKYLPYYMIPTHYIHIDSIPLRPNGKMDRKALPEPKIDDFFADYVAPRDDLEKALCDAYAKVLKLKKIGIHDDFYQLGGDSMGAMDVLVASDIKGLSTSDIFSGRTPEKVIALYKEKHPNGVTESEEEIDDKARSQAQPLLPMQTFMLDYQMYTPKSTMLNLYSLLKFDKNEMDIEKVADAVEATIKNHPALLTTFSFNDDGELRETYHPEMAKKIQITKVSEIEMEVIKDSLVRPFKILNSQLFRAELFETEKNGYLFFDVHHTVFDGTSLGVIMQDIVKAYYDVPLERDYFYSTLKERNDIKLTPRYLNDKKYFEDRYDHTVDYAGRPKLDFEVRDNTLDTLYADMSKDDALLTMVEEKYGVSRNAFFATVAMLAISAYNREANVQMSWTYNGRYDLQKMGNVGLLLYDLPLALELKKCIFRLIGALIPL